MLLSDVLRRARERQLLSPADLMLPVRTSPRATLPLPEGMAALELPSKLSHRSIKALKAWIAVMIDLAQNNEDDSKAISQILDEPEQDH
jgi:hypothetical protein